MPDFDTLDVGGGMPVTPWRPGAGSRRRAHGRGGPPAPGSRGRRRAHGAGLTRRRAPGMGGLRGDEDDAPPAPGPERFAAEIPLLLEAIPADRRPRRLAVEPGRVLVASAGWLVARGPPRARADAASGARVRRSGRAPTPWPSSRRDPPPTTGRVASSSSTPGMTELIRPALYGAEHAVVALTSLGRVPRPDAAARPARVDGPDLRVDRHARRAPPAAAPPRRPRGDRRRRRVRCVDALHLQRAAAARRGDRGDGRHADAGPPARHPGIAGVTVGSAPGARLARGSARDAPWRLRRLIPVLAVLLALVAWLAPVVPARAETPAGPALPRPGRRPGGLRHRRPLRRARRSRRPRRRSTRIEERTGAEVVVYTQVKPGATTESTEADAIDLIDQWGVGRQGFDDGLAILMNVYTEAGGRVRGQVQLYAAPGFRALYLTNEERQQIFEEEMLPRLRDQQFDDGAPGRRLRGSTRRRPASGPASSSSPARLDAVIGIIGGLGGFLLLAGYAFFHWRRYGRDPYVVDSPSIYLPAPPAELTAAGGALLHDGSSSRRTLTTALLDLASRDELAFRATTSSSAPDEVTVEIHPPDRRRPADPAQSAQPDCRRPRTTRSTSWATASEARGRRPGPRQGRAARVRASRSRDFDERLEARAGPPRLVHRGAGQGHGPLAPHRRRGDRRGDRRLLGRARRSRRAASRSSPSGSAPPVSSRSSSPGPCRPARCPAPR